MENNSLDYCRSLVCYSLYSLRGCWGGVGRQSPLVGAGDNNGNVSDSRGQLQWYYTWLYASSMCDTSTLWWDGVEGIVIFGWVGFLFSAWHVFMSFYVYVSAHTSCLYTLDVRFCRFFCKNIAQRWFLKMYYIIYLRIIFQYYIVRKVRSADVVHWI